MVPGGEGDLDGDLGESCDVATAGDDGKSAFSPLPLPLEDFFGVRLLPIF